MIKNILKFIFLICFLLPQYGVYAQEPTATETPTPTITPTPEVTQIGQVTATPFPGSCPNVTPMPTALSWEFYNLCGICAPTPTSSVLLSTENVLDLNMLTTATPTVTPVLPTPTQTLTPNIIAYIGGTTLTNGVSWTHEVASFGASNYPNDKMSVEAEQYASGGTHYLVGVKIITTAYIVGNTGSAVGVNMCIKNSSNQTIELRGTEGYFAGNTKLFAANSTEYCYPIDNGVTTLSSSQEQVFDMYVPSAKGNKVVDFTVRVYPWGMKSTSSGSALTYVWQYKTDGYPVPSATPVPGFCNNWHYADEDSTDQIASYSGMSIYQGECVVLIPDFGIHLPAVGEVIDPIDWDVHGVSLCPKWVNLGSFSLAGFTIPSDIIAIPAVMALFWMILQL